MSFDDQIYIKKIRDQLWTSRNIGNATVMIGSGFSRFSSLYDNGQKKFPLWDDLKQRIIKELNQRNNNETPFHKSPLKLASEFQASFGRQNLEYLIEDEIPDMNFEPSDLHELLLKLPWSDVFTTNYDTLIERAASKVHERKYEIIFTPQDIPGKSKPRIVKLHGSIPSTKPYIFTEEDYRTYPFKFAPFVNTVQQALMENALCLLGFSGEDPNFKNWIGWVRDNLGESKIPIYLVGVLNLQKSERELLLKRDIRPIDLAPLFPIDQFSNPDLRHYKATKWFLLSLYMNKPPNKINWPEYTSKKNIEIDSDLPNIPNYSKSKLIDIKPPNYNDKSSDVDLESILIYWENERSEYPGWIIAPLGAQNRIWMHLDQRYRYIIHNFDQFELINKLKIANEICWRFNLCLFPLWDNMIPSIINLLIKNNPFAELNEIDFIKGINTKRIYNKIERNVLKNYWTNILISILKYYKEKHNDEEFYKWLDILNKIKKLNKNWEVEYYYLASLYELEKLNSQKLQEYLTSWKYYSELPEWNLKKASILLEIGETDKANDISAKALRKIRSQLNNSDNNFKLYSEEGIALFLLSLIEQTKKFRNWKDIDPYWSRLEDLRLYKSDINEFLQYSTYNLLSEEFKISGEIETHKFDPGKRVKTFSFNSKNFEIQRYSYNYLRLFFEAGLPFNTSNINLIDKDSVSKACKALTLQETRLIFATLIRCNDKELIEEWFDRVRVSQLEDEDAIYLIEQMLKAFAQGLESLYNNHELAYPFNGNIAYKQVKVASQILSLFTIRMNDDHLSELFKLILKFYNLPVHNLAYFHENVAKLFERYIYQFNDIDINKTKLILDLKIPGEIDYNIMHDDRWPEPTIYIKNIKFKDKPDAINQLEGVTTRLFNLFNKKDKELRIRSFHRLVLLYENNLLSEDDTIKFAKSIWKYLDNNKLPRIGNYYKNYLITLPSPPNINTKDRFREFLLNSNFNRIVKVKKDENNKTQRTISIGNNSNIILINEFIFGTKNCLSYKKKGSSKFLLEIDDKLYSKLIEITKNWWDNEKDEISYEDKHMNSLSYGNTVRDNFQNVVPLLSSILIPFATDEDNLKSILKIVEEMEIFQINTLTTKPALAYKNLLTFDDLIQSIKTNINSNSQKNIREAISAIRYWINIINYHNWNNHDIPDDLLTELININRISLINRRSLVEIISLINWILINDSKIFISKNHLIVDLLKALEHLYNSTQFPNEQDRLNQISSSSAESIKELPELKMVSSELAKLLHEYYLKEKKEIPNIILKWKELSLHSNLPELKKFWEFKEN